MDLNSTVLADVTGSAQQPYWCSPLPLCTSLVLFFIVERWIFGTAPYLCSRAWYALVMFIPFPFVAFGAGFGGMCVPFRLDWQTGFHCLVVLLYCQIDLFLTRRMVAEQYAKEGGPSVQEVKDLFDGKEQSINVFYILFKNFHPCEARGPMDLGMPSIVRGVFEFNGAMLHEIWWNIFICQNFIDNGFPWYIAILAVPTFSCLVHGITSNWIVGYRCFPQFLWTALAYHASGSVLVPGLIHSMWYFGDARQSFLLTLSKHEWDKEDRKDEEMCPHADKYFFYGLAWVAIYYAGVNYLVHMQFPWLKSHDPHIDQCPYGEFIPPFGWNRPLISFEGFLFFASLGQFIAGFATWKLVRAGMDETELDGDMTEEGKQRFADSFWRAWAGEKSSSSDEGSSSDDSDSGSDREEGRKTSALE